MCVNNSLVFPLLRPLAVAGIVVYFVDAPMIDFRVNCGPVQALGIAMPFFGTANFIPIGWNARPVHAMP